MPKKRSKRPRSKKKAKKSSKRKPISKKVTKKKAAKSKAAKKKSGKKPRKTVKKTAPKSVVKPLPTPTPLRGRKSPVSTAPPVSEKKVGVVVHYYSHLGVAVVRLDQGQIQVGDTLHIKGHTTDFKQAIESMEIDHQKIPRAMAGQEFGLKVYDHAREHDEVFKVRV